MTNRIEVSGVCPACGQPAVKEYLPYSSAECREQFRGKVFSGVRPQLKEKERFVPKTKNVNSVNQSKESKK